MDAGETLLQGWRLHQAGKIAQGEQLYRQVLQQHPQDANAWCYLGIACHDQDRLDEAVAAYRRAILLQPRFPVAYNNLGNTYRLLRRMTESIACFDEALRQQPGYVNAHKNKGTALVWEGRLSAALECYAQALQYAPDDPETHKNRGVILLLQGRFSEGWPEYQWRWRTAELQRPQYERPAWDGSSLDGRTILLTAEQGLGDTLQFIRYAGVLKQRYRCRVIAACHRPLLSLLAGSPDLDGLIAVEDPPPEFDVFCPLLDLPAVLGEQPETIPGNVPYLLADPDLCAQWKQRLSVYGGFKIGLAWQGNPKYQADRMRSFPLEALEPFAHLHGVRFFSLQKGPGVEQLDDLAARIEVVRLGDQLDETTGAFVETAAVLKNLDLVIAADTAVAHVAGGLGVPLWVALAHVPHWPWLLEREDSPWYPTATLFRQSSPGDWQGVFGGMAERLLAFPGVRRKTHAEYRLADCGVNRLVRARHGLMLFNRRDRYIGRSLDRYGEFSEGECDLFRQLLKPGQTVVEAGANVGAHTLPLAQLVGKTGRVFAFEPQRVLFQILCGNVALNGRTNVECSQKALGDQPGWLRAAAVDYGQESNLGGVHLGSGESGEAVEVRTLDSLQLAACHLLKVDVEGMELSVLRGGVQTIAAHRPLLYVENDRPEQSPALIEFLLAQGYELYWHLPPLFRGDNYFGNPQDEFPGIVSANMLGVHQSLKASVAGLRRIEGPYSDWRA